MPARNGDAEEMVARLTTVSAAVHALLNRLLIAGVLGPNDLAAMRELGLQLAADIREAGSGLKVSGDRLEAEVRAFWEVIGVPSAAARTH